MNRLEAGFAFMRHGKTAWNLENRIQGKTDVPLLHESIEETRQTAFRLRELGLYFRTVYTSSLQRSIETGEIAKEVLGIKRDFIEPRFNERGAGILEGKTFREIAEGRYSSKDVSIEPKPSFRTRVVEGMDYISRIQTEDYGLVVVHAAVLRVLLDEFAGYRLDAKQVPHNTVFVLSPGKEFSIVQ